MFHVKTSRKCCSPSTSSSIPSCHSAREAVFLVLERCALHRPVQAALHEILDRVTLSEQDKALTTELVYGYLRREPSLRWLVAHYLKAPEKLPPAMLQRLESAAYELFCLDRIPAHATVDTTVSEIKKRFGQSLSRVANGLLRNLVRLHEQEGSLDRVLVCLTSQDHQLTPLEQLEITSGVPQWILSLWHSAYGEETAHQLAESASKTPWSCIRINRLRPGWRASLEHFCRPPSSSGFDKSMNAGFDECMNATLPAACGEQVGFSGVRFPPGKNQASLRHGLLAGDFSRQGGGSQALLAALLSEGEEDPGVLSGSSATPPGRLRSAPVLEEWYRGKPFWDACAGYGGKTFALAELGLNIWAASDINLSRLQGIRREARRLHLSPPPIFCASAAAPALRKGPPLVIVDAPCSGLGTLARRPDLRRLRRPEQISELVALQKDLLRACWELTPAGGRLVYMTCTVNPGENEQQVRAFLAEHSEAELHREWRNTPDACGTDLMYGAVLRKA